MRSALQGRRKHSGDQPEIPAIQTSTKKVETSGEDDVDHQLPLVIHHSETLLNPLKATMHGDAHAEQGSRTACFEPRLKPQKVKQPQTQSTVRPIAQVSLSCRNLKAV
ncbi:hypothetical protein [Synechococcus sp. MIT S9504]|uniref:hypothetical protein n=1 Tax=Synechococcus sp. MIT S9504 TaxID=1801628 RepID=UPI0012E963E3|nr:hypothetical protein [Synechococcus sp. MIT S9504]